MVVARMRELLVPFRGGTFDLVAYHLGWADASGRPLEAPAGKLLRPTLCLTAASGYGDAADALDAGVALELLHAFSLVHDDIEDADRLRHHRPTVWSLWGVPLAINAGDALFALAHRTLAEAAANLPQERCRTAFRLFSDAVLRMIEGQHADIEFESRPSVSLAEYEAMAAGKTGALIGASLALGGLFAGTGEEDVELLRRAGVELGLAFQAVDDALAVWGDAAVTGKATGNDAARGKKSLPTVIAARTEANGRNGALPPDGALRAEVGMAARGHAAEARALLGETRLAPSAVAELERLISFILEREA
jgi:geranylgeranyl diphosphate synthase type I